MISGCGIAALILLSSATEAQLIDYNQQIKNKPGLSGYIAAYTLAANCTAANAAKLELIIPFAITGLTTQTISCLSTGFAPGATLQPASGQTLTFTGIINAAPVAIFDVSPSSSTVYFSSGTTLVSYPQWFGGLGNGVHDDTAAFQAAIDACRGPLTGGQYLAVCGVSVPFTSTSYLITDTVKLHSASAPYRSMYIEGAGKDRATINWNGNSTSKDSIHMVGFFQHVSNLAVHLLSPARDVISYDGSAAIGASSGGYISEVEIECNNFQANGITGGRGASQADQVKIDHPYIIGCGKGYSIISLDPNAVSWNIYTPSISHGWVGIASATSSTMNVYGGEIDYMQTNFYPGAGSVMRIDGVRSEGSERGWFTTIGVYQQPLTVTGGQYAAPTSTRQTTSGAGTTTTNILTLSQCTLNTSPDCFVPGDNIIIAGAGPAGAALHAQITGYSALWTVVTLSQNISTTVSSAAVTLDGTVVQPAFVEAGFGPYMHLNFNVNSTTNWAFQRNTVGGPQIFEGVSFLAATTNPFGLTTQASCSASNISWKSLTANLVAIPDFSQIQVVTNDDVGTSRPIYINLQNNDTGSSNNHIVGTNAGWCYWPLHEGMMFIVQLSTPPGGISLQAGANDFTYGSNGTINIKSSRVLASNIATGYSVNGTFTGVFSAGVLRDVSQ